MRELGFSIEFIKQVVDIVGSHHEHPDHPSEPFRVLYDSDKIVMFSKEEYPYYNSKENFDWNKIIALIYSTQGKQLAEQWLQQRRKEQGN